jgi:hypothetical protein
MGYAEGNDREQKSCLQLAFNRLQASHLPSEALLDRTKRDSSGATDHRRLVA